MKTSEIKFPTLLGLMVALGGLVSGLWLVQGQVRKSISAAADETPKEVKITNVTDTSFVASWITDKAATGYVQYGEGAVEQNMVVTDERDQQKGSVDKYLTHFVTIKGLKPETTYKFKIGSGKKLYDLNGLPYSTATGQRIDTEPVADVAYGQAITGEGEPADGAIVYLQITGGVAQAAMVKPSGSWVIPLSTIRSTNMKNYVTYNKQTARLDLVVNNGALGKSTINVYTKDDSPVPEIIIGRDYNYLTGVTANTDASESAVFSKITQPTQAPPVNDLVVLTPRTGDKLNSDKPEIIGSAPAGTTVTIEIRSANPVTGTVVADKDGKFTYSVPTGLAAGDHTLTVSAVVDGVIKKITRSFTVYAAGESTNPAFTATPSATLTPKPSVKPTATPIPTATPKPTATPRPTATPKPTVTPKLSATPKPTISPNPSVTIKPTATPVPTKTPTPTPTLKPTPTIKPLVTITPKPTPTTTMPRSGNSDQTIFMMILGLGLTISGWWWYRKAL